MTWVLAAAGIYNLLWAASVALKPEWLFERLGLAPVNYIEVWQGLAMIIGVLGVGYLAAATNPSRHWPVVLVGLLTKLFACVGFLRAALEGRWPWSVGWGVLLNDAIWLFPFALILAKAYALRQVVVRKISPAVQEMALRSRTNKGSNLLEMSKRQPILLVFLRHFGCPFCRETLSDLSKQRREIESTGTQIVLVHLSPDQQAHDVFLFYGLSDLPRVSDKGELLYRAFGLGHGNLLNLFGPTALWRFFADGIFVRHGMGWILGDMFQMPGIFLVFQGHIVRSFLHQSVADRPNYRRMVQLGLDESSDEAVAS
jgi:peroxiredoxin